MSDQFMLSTPKYSIEPTVRGALNLHRRNTDFINRYNPKHLFDLADNKIKTKQKARLCQIQTPHILDIINNIKDVYKLRSIRHIPTIVIKPAQGSGGRGILILNQHGPGQFSKINGEIISFKTICQHLEKIFRGEYTLGGYADVAMVEQVVPSHSYLKDYSLDGLPDIRIIVFAGYPIMAMLRLATSMSEGKANLHQGAIGVGLNIHAGQAIKAIQFNRFLSTHPDTGRLLSKIQVPFWNKMLHLAAQCYDMSGLGYLGVDIVLDAHRGPLLLELNARPGLSIQTTNGLSLLPRLKTIENLCPMNMTPQQRINYVKKEFSTL
ncbi:MAG: alpha-L-glutamate ligase-like protein [Shewanellaceae bacterium]|nr:alpha-L-glutamate ligase-like protein [Shewanellaceae bacterium]